MSYLIIGASAAGVHAALAIKEVDIHAEITIIGEEPWPYYSRVLAPEVLFGQRSENELWLKSGQLQGTTLRLGVKAIEIDRTAKQVRLDDGSVLPYDKLLVATGSRPIVPPIPGVSLPGIHTLWTLQDAKSINTHLPIPGRVIIVGGGLIGLHAARSLHHAGCQLTIVERQERLMAQQLDPIASELLRLRLEEEGIQVLCSCSATKFSGDDRVQSVELMDGRTIACDLAIMAVGVQPRAELATQAGLQTNRGIIVNEKMQTSDSDIYAAGDVTEDLDLVRGERGLNAIWPRATEQGRAAGLNMAGMVRVYEGSINLNSFELCNLPMISIGAVSKHPDWQEWVHKMPNSSVYRRLYTHEGILKGALLVGNLELAGSLHSMMRQKKPVHGMEEALVKGTANPGSLMFTASA